MTAANEDSAARVEALAARLTLLEDERAIIDTLHRYGQAADDGRVDDWVELFEEEGEFRSTNRQGDIILHEKGRDALRAWLQAFRAGETKLSKHCVLAPVIRIDGGTAIVDSYLMRLIENDDPHRSPAPLLMGRYRDDMVKGADGRWRFRERFAMVEAPIVPGPSNR